MSVLENSQIVAFLRGEWVDCDIVCEYFGISFSDGLKLFDFGRMAHWNPAPLNGQRIDTKFRLKTSDASWPEDFGAPGL